MKSAIIFTVTVLLELASVNGWLEVPGALLTVAWAATFLAVLGD